MEKRKVKWTGVALIFLMVVVTFSGCVGQEEEGKETVTTTRFETVTTTEVKLETKLPEVIKIGVVLPLTGALGAYGPDMVRGAQIAAHVINRDGGIMGSMIELIVEDSETTPEGSVESATKLVEIDKVQAIIGAAGSSNTLGIARGVTIDSNVILISPASTSPELTGVDDDNTLWRTAGPDRFQGMAMADLADYMDWTTTAIMTLDNSYGIGLANAFEDAWDGEVLTRIEYDPAVLAWQTELTAIDAMDPDFLWLCCYQEDGSEVMRELKELAIDIPVMSADGFGDPTVVTDNDVASRVVNPPTIGTMPYTPESPGKVHFHALWAEAHVSEASMAEWGLHPGGAAVGSTEPGIYAREAYDAMNLIALAIAYSGEYTADAIKEWFPYVSTLYKPASGDKTFDEFGDVAQDYAVYRFTGEGTVATTEFETIGSWNAITGLSITSA